MQRKDGCNFSANTAPFHDRHKRNMFHSKKVRIFINKNSRAVEISVSLMCLTDQDLGAG